jgi:hypothetical protein
MQIKNKYSSNGTPKKSTPIKYLELNPQISFSVNTISQIIKGIPTSKQAITKDLK